MPAFFIDSRDIHGELVTIAGELFHHLRTSLRLQINEALQLTDEHRRRHHAIVTETTRTHITVRIMATTHAPEHRHPALILGQAILKGDHMDWVMQKAGELGVQTIVPLVTHRTVVRPRQTRVDSQTARWQRITREAAQQSEQWQAPAVQPPCAVSDFVSQTKAAGRLILLERAQGMSLSDIPMPVGSATVAIAVGPEGGWQADEVTMAKEQGFHPITLGSTILRSETAALAAIAILQSRLGLLG